jgi:hypothetical protein
MATPPLVCIISSSAQAAIEEERLAAAGARVRRAASSPGCDLLFSSAGTTLAFLLLDAAAVPDSGAGAGAGAGGDAVLARVEQLARGFRRGYVLLPYEAAGAAAVLAARFGAEASLSFVVMPLLASFTAQALAIAQAVLDASGAAGGWREEQEAVAASADGVAQALGALPLPRGCDRGHTANMLRTLGSLQHISQASSAEIAGATDLEPAAAAALAAFFRRGCVASARPLGTQPRAPLMRSL